MHQTSPTSVHMCELDPTDFTVPEGFITELEFHVLLISVKYLQEGFFWKLSIVTLCVSKVRTGHPASARRIQHTGL